MGEHSKGQLEQDKRTADNKWRAHGSALKQEVWYLILSFPYICLLSYSGNMHTLVSVL